MGEKHFHGKFVRHPFIPARRIPIVTDTMVDREFGTGAVKITPAHDQNDYDVGKRHDLEFINILNDDGTLNENAGEQFKVTLPVGCGNVLTLTQGMRRFHARKAVIEELKKLGLYVETKDNAMKVPLCSCVSAFLDAILPSSTTGGLATS